MIARLTVAVPFAIAVPDGAAFSGFAYEEDGCTIVSRPPGKSDQPFKVDVPAEVEVDGVKGFVANALQFDFHKADFDRAKGSQTFDPPLELMQRVVSSFIARLRFVTRAPQVQQIELVGGATWHVQYVNDDGSELAEDPDRVRGRSGRSFSISLTSMTPPVWDKMHEFDTEWSPPVWDDILLDAANALPRIGTAVVLAATALEVFVADILERLAAAGDVPADVWNWINKRDGWLKAPSTEEQFDVLLKHFTIHSLKDNSKLWQALKEVRTARNTFVHEGVARIGGTTVTIDKARQLVASTGDIIKTVRGWLPEEKRWAQPEVNVQLSFIIPLT